MRGLGKDYKNVEWLAVNSLCGAVDCSMCRFYLDKQCQGCILQNQLLATKDNHVCEIYKCILNKDILSCNDCNKYPCQKFESLKNWGFLGSKCRLSFVPHNLSHKKTDLIQLKTLPRTDANHTANDLPEKVIARLIRYLSYLEDYHYKGKESISSEEISENAGVTASLVRKDLCIFGAFGVPKVGYNVNFLRRRLRAILKLNYVRNMAWVGVDKFKELMSLLPLFSEHGCRILALFSHDPRYIGRKITNLTVFDIEKMELVIRRLKINVAVVATPSDKTQLTINSLLKCGVKNMLNYSESSVKVPAGIVLRNIGFSHDLKLFSFYSIEG